MWTSASRRIGKGTCMPAFSEGDIASRCDGKPWSIRSNAGAPGDSKLTEETSERCARLFVAHGCMSRLRWQLPASCDQYHRTQDRLPIPSGGGLADAAAHAYRAGA